MRLSLLAALLLLLSLTLALPNASYGVTVLGNGTGALLQNDLTDPEGDGDDAGNNYNATFFANKEPGFGGGEFAFNVFDNKVGGGNDKWCCNPASAASPTIVGADFGADQYILTHFTIANNDTDSREPDVWAVQGSNDGVTWDDIFTYDNDGTGAFFAADGDNDDNEVLRYDAGTDFVLPTTAYSQFRLFVESDTGGGGLQISEFELFGTLFEEVPEPTSVAIWSVIGLGLAGFGWFRMRRKN